MNTTIDEALYSRQLYVMGKDAMEKMAKANVLLIGLNGLGIEIAKNIVLAGINALTVYDNTNCELRDLGSQFYLTEESINKNKAEESIEKLRSLNPYVKINLLKEFKLEELENKYDTVVMVNKELNELTKVNDYTHKRNIKFISARVDGLFGQVFCDFGEDFVVIDKNGNERLSGIITNITKEKDAIITCLDDKRHGLTDGMKIKIEEVNGMDEINNRICTVESIGPYTFKIKENTEEFKDYVGNGIYTEVKEPVKMSFKALRENLVKPSIMITDFAKMETPYMIHRIILELSNLKETPKTNEEITELAKKIEGDKAEELLRIYLNGLNTVLPPMAAVIGGFVAQEAIKSISGKFTPLDQMLYFDAVECLFFNNAPQSKITNDRYFDQRRVFGDDFVSRILGLRSFVVGSGAIGCELLKNAALIGLGTQQNGRIIVTDNDLIEKSNLNRQFLFRSKDVGRFKSATAADAVVQINPALHGRVDAKQDRVGLETENVYDDLFYDSVDVVFNALDNVEARRYMDLRCVYYKKPLLESGTLGTSGNVQVIVPNLTESYSSSQDPPEKSIPICTLKNFPNQIEHTIQFARDMFEGLFTKPFEGLKLYVDAKTKDEFVNKLTATEDTNNAIEILQNIIQVYTSQPNSTSDCVIWARNLFEGQFSNNIKQLLFNFPKDAVTSSGAPFWSGPKRMPEHIEFDLNNQLHLDLIVYAAKLRAFNFGLKDLSSVSVDSVRGLLASYQVPEFVPKSGVKIQVSENEPSSSSNTTSKEDLINLKQQLPEIEQIRAMDIKIIEFEKDDDSNNHIDFVTSFSNLRALNYKIKPATRLATKQIAGKIIPAIATTTALTVGLVMLEFYKLVDYLSNHNPAPTDEQWLDKFKNGFVNLALPLLAFSSPIKAQQFKYNETQTFTLWDRFEINQDITLKEFLEYFQTEHQLEVQMLSSGVSMLYSSFMQKKKVQERINLRMSELVELVSKKKIDKSHKKYIIFEVCVSDKNGDDVEVPYCRIKVSE